MDIFLVVGLDPLSQLDSTTPASCMTMAAIFKARLFQLSQGDMLVN